jgi:heme exporter protein B
MSSPSRLQVARVVFAKDVRIERRSKVLTSQIMPFAVVTLVLFAFALDGDVILQRTAPGLVWLAMLFSSMIIVQRSFALETADGALDALRVAGADMSAVFWGKCFALVIQLLVLELVLLAGAIVMYGIELRGSGVVLLVTSSISATCGLSAVSTIYAGLASGVRGRESLLPLLVLPVASPVLIGATRAAEAAFGTGGTVVSEGWPWLGVLSVFAVVFGFGGSLAFGPLIDD